MLLTVRFWRAWSKPFTLQQLVRMKADTTGTWREPFSCSLTFRTRIVQLNLILSVQTMTKTSRVAASPTPKRATKPASKRSATPASKRTKRSATNVAIATELAPAVAIALLAKTEQPPGAPAAALDVLAAAAAPSEIEGNVRLQLMFENGEVLPVEMSADAGAALSKGLQEELPKQ